MEKENDRGKKRKGRYSDRRVTERWKKSDRTVTTTNKERAFAGKNRGNVTKHLRAP